MFHENDTIAAIATAVSDSGIGIIRISGINAVETANKFVVSPNYSKNMVLKQASHTIRLGFFCSRIDDSFDEHCIIDEVMVSVMKAPKSYTKEDVVEINCHGGIVVINKILGVLINGGCRLADPGEFTKRAFLNGRIDLTQAEAVMDTISAQNEFALNNSEMQLHGLLKTKINDFRKQILYNMAFIESAIDDPENYDLTGFPERLSDTVSSIINDCDILISSFDEGHMRKDGINTVIIGKPNAGKSSLLNLLAGEERAIVTDIAGTTRDNIEDTIRLGDFVLNINDTAGIRNTDNVIERIGVQRAVSLAEKADLILYMIDSTRELDANDSEIISKIKDKNFVVILNKTDLSDKVILNEKELFSFFSSSDNYSKDSLLNYTNDGIPYILAGSKKQFIIKASMVEENGIVELKNIISEMFFSGKLLPQQEMYITNVRHKNALCRATESLRLVMNAIDDNMSEDFYSIDLMNAYEAFGSIIGEDVGEDLVNEIFEKFCMGK